MAGFEYSAYGGIVPLGMGVASLVQSGARADEPVPAHSLGLGVVHDCSVASTETVQPPSLMNGQVSIDSSPTLPRRAASQLGQRNLVSDAKARIREIKQELKRADKLRVELTELERLVAAATQRKPAVKRTVRSAISQLEN